MEGKCRWWNRKRGFGFIMSDEGEDIFVHYSDLADGLSNLREGEKVSFAEVFTDRGKKATAVRSLDGPRMFNRPEKRQHNRRP